MPWITPTLRSVRQFVRGEITSALSGASFVPNSVLRVVADAQAALAHLTLRYLDWIARQLLPDTAEKEWLDRHGNIWLENADGSRGRKMASFASGTVNFIGTPGTVIPIATVLVGTNQLSFETTEQIIIGAGPTLCAARALDPGAAGNIDVGELISPQDRIDGVDQIAIVTMVGGADTELDDDLRTRVLLRIRQPPMGGDADDYAQWSLRVPGVTRAWAVAHEMGTGTVVVRFMMDDLRASNAGLPLPTDITAVQTYLDLVRPVTVKELYVVAPVPEPIDFTITNLQPDSTDIRANIADSVDTMIKRLARPAFTMNGVEQPAQTIFAVWVAQAVMEAPGVESFDLVMVDHVMPTAGSLATLGTITYA